MALWSPDVLPILLCCLCFFLDVPAQPGTTKPSWSDAGEAYPVAIKGKHGVCVTLYSDKLVPRGSLQVW